MPGISDNCDFLYVSIRESLCCTDKVFHSLSTGVDPSVPASPVPFEDAIHCTYELQKARALGVHLPNPVATMLVITRHT